MWKHLIAVFWLLGMIFSVRAQEDSLRFIRTEKWIEGDSLRVRFHGFSVWSEHFKVLDSAGKTVPDSLYEVDFVRAVLRWRKVPHGRLRVVFYQYPRAWVDTLRRVDVYMMPAGYPQETGGGEKPDFFDGLKAEGEFERGVMGGNRQNVSSPSKLDLSLNGKLTPEVYIRANIHDDNLPDAYKGVTTTFKDVNRIFLEITGPSWQVNGGDRTWTFDNVLLPLQRENKGLALRVGKENHYVRVSAAITKGKYHHMKFDLKPGNYGPYRLTGPAGNLYIYVVPESEKVYINGELMQRGEDKDYTVDYGTAEIRLNPRLAIRDFDVMYVEFLYANQNYQQWTSLNEIKTGGSKNRWRFFSFNESDIKTKALLFSPDEQLIRRMQAIPGDNETKTVIARESEWDAEKILYKKVVTGSDFHFEYVPAEPQPPETLYEVRFEYTGEGKGEYVIDKYLAQGRVMRYVGAGQGDFSHWVSLKTPKSYVYAGMEFRHRDTLFEWDVSAVWNRNNPNLFYTGNNRTQAVAVDMNGKFFLLNDSLKTWTLAGKWRYKPGEYRPTGDLFRPDFTDNWPVDNPNTGMHRWLEMSSTFNSKKYSSEAKTGDFQLQDSIRLQQFSYSHRWEFFPGWQWNSLNFTTGGKLGPQVKTSLGHVENGWEKTQGKWRPGISFTYERKSFEQNRTPREDSYAYLKSDVRLKYVQPAWNILLSAGNIQTDSVRNASWEKVYNLRFLRNEWEINKKYWKTQGGVEWQFSSLNRNETHQNYFLNLTVTDKKHINRLQLDGSVFGSHVPKREIIFRRVPDGQGQYQWTDYNGNGTQEIEEFEPAYYPDRANYIKVWLPSGEYLPAYTQKVTLGWNINTRKLSSHPFWQAWKNFLMIRSENQSRSRFSAEHFYRFDSVTLQGFQQLTERLVFKPHLWPVRGEYTLYIHQRTENLYNGRRGGFQRKHVWKASYWPHKHVETGIEIVNGALSFRSEEYALKNYGYIFLEQSLFTGYKTPQFQWEIRLIRAIKDNENGILLQKKELHASWNYSRKQTLFSLDIRLLENIFNGNPLSPLGFTMLEGLKPGKNMVLNFRWNREIRKDVFLQIFYQMRAARNTLPVHTANISLRVVF